MKTSIINTQLHADSVVILANGDYPTHELPLKVLHEASYVVCCDGAANEFLRCGGEPNVVIGDGDSLLPEYRHLLMQIDEQDDNDLTKAVNYLLEQGHNRIDIVGATGRREDHTIGNISLLMNYQQVGADVRMFTDFGVFIPCREGIKIQCSVGQQVSIFNFGATNLSADGLRYPLYDFTNLWQGTLNEATSDEVSIYASGEYLIFLEY